KRSTDRRRQELQSQGWDAAAFGRHLVVADGGKSSTQPGILDGAGDEHGRNGQAEHHAKKVTGIGSEKSWRIRPQHGNAASAADEMPVDEYRIEYHRECEGRDRKEDPSQAQCEVTHAQTETTRTATAE